MYMQDIEFKSGTDPSIQEFYDTTRIILNDGRTQFRVISEVPTWVGNEGEMVFYAAGNVRRVYTYLGGSWTYFGFADTNNQILIDGTITIGSYLKADSISGLWMGHHDWASSPFRVNMAGALWATSATITGTITASAGSIGGWTINASSLTAGSGATSVGMAPGTVPFWAGHGTALSAPFYVINNGEVHCTNIIASGGTIGGWNIATTRIYGTATPYIDIDNANTRIQTSDFVSGALGSGWSINAITSEFNNIRARGILSTSVFQKTAISSIGGNFLVSDSDVLNVDMTAADNSTLTITGQTTFAVNDILRIKDGTNDEWLLVTNIGSAPTYIVTRDQASAYTSNINPVWKKGTCVVNYGASGEGLIYMTASDANSPHIDVLTHAGSPWTTTTTRLRVGNVNGFLGAATDLYGIYIGETNAYLKYDPTNGLQIKGKVTITGGTATQTFVQASIPTSIAVGDSWIDTDDSNKFYIAASVGADAITAGEWELAGGGGSGGVTTFAQDSIPTSTSVGDLWADTNDSNKLYRAASVGANEITAGEWILVRDAASDTLDTWRMSGHTTYIDGGDIYTGTVTATQISVAQLDAITVNTGSLTVDETINVGTNKVVIDGANTVIKVYDASSNLRVELGLLS